MATDDVTDDEGTGDRARLFDAEIVATRMGRMPQSWIRLVRGFSIWEDTAQRRFVITRSLTEEDGLRQVDVVAYETESYRADDLRDYHSKRVDAINASGYVDRIVEYQLALNGYAKRIKDARGGITINDIPPEILEESMMTEPGQFMQAIDRAMDGADQAGKMEMLMVISHRLQELGIEPKDADGKSISYFKLADILVSPLDGMLWLGHPAYKRLVDDAHADYADRLSSRTNNGSILSHVNEHFGKRQMLFSRMLHAAYGKRVHPDTLEAIRPHFETDHLNSRLCDDPVNFFLLFGSANSKFGYERLMKLKKEFTGQAWAGVVYFVSRAIELQQRLYRA